MTNKSTDNSTNQAITQLKARLRAKLRHQRSELSIQSIKQADEALAKQYLKHFAEKNNQKIAIYLAHDQEVGKASCRERV